MAGLDSEIDAEIERLRASGGNWLNNFHGNLPGGYRARRMDLCEPTDRFTYANYSVHMRSKTFAEFFADCRQAVLQAGMQETEPVKLWESHFRDEITEEEWCERMVPVYKILRNMGYMCFDLTC